MPGDFYTNVTIDNRSFSILKFDARAGLKMARLLMAKIAPLIPYIVGDDEQKKSDDKKPAEARAVKALAESFSKKLDRDGEQNLYATVGVLLEKLDDETIDYIIDKCLMHCFEILPAGNQPVLYANGIYGVEGVKESIPLTVRLCYEAIKWGASDFFDGKTSALIQKLKEFGKRQNQ